MPGWCITTESRNLVTLPAYPSAVALRSLFSGPRRISYDRCRRGVPLLGAADVRELRASFRGCQGPWRPRGAQERKASDASRLLSSPIFFRPGLLQVFRLSYCINLTNWRRGGLVVGGWREMADGRGWREKKGGKTP